MPPEAPKVAPVASPAVKSVRRDARTAEHQVSFPSQTGSMLAIIRSRSASRGAKKKTGCQDPADDPALISDDERVLTHIERPNAALLTHEGRFDIFRPPDF